MGGTAMTSMARGCVWRLHVEALPLWVMGLLLAHLAVEAAAVAMDAAHPHRMPSASGLVLSFTPEQDILSARRTELIGPTPTVRPLSPSGYIVDAVTTSVVVMRAYCTSLCP